ncbi:MAG TPA: sulfotransferase domain-containing protein [Verrucomicrobiae bacterium]|jgi:hypothetical protein|nr:sulfotransferase domain-containing protein [Verrucomicrobiae bacterium]
MIRAGKPAHFLKKFLPFQRPRVPKGFSYIHDTLPQDVFIVGYPKSGNTWFQNLVSGLVHGVNPRVGPPSLASDLVPDVHANEFYRRYSTPTYFKSHALPQPHYRRVVYLLRDGRDAMVSFLHYAEALEKRKLNFLEFVNNPIRHSSSKWHEHVEAWTQNPFDAQMIVIKYEDMLEQPVTELERFCEFIGLLRDRAALSAVAEGAQFSSLREKEASIGWGGQSAWPKDKFFFRRGVAGSHKDEMPPEVVAAFLSEAGKTLRLHGYEVEEPKAFVPSAVEPVMTEPQFVPAARVSA